MIGRSAPGPLERLGVEQLVLDADHGAVVGAQHPAPDHALRLGGGGLVEHRGRGGAPVDEQGVALGVAQADPADVAGLGVDALVEVEAPEDQPLVGGVELGDPLGRLEHHRVALDEPALVAEPAAAVALGGELLGAAGARLELDVDAVDVLLLGGDLTTLEIFAHSGFPLCTCIRPRLPSGGRQTIEDYSPEASGRRSRREARVVAASGPHFAPVEERRHRLAGLVAGEQGGAEGRHLGARARRCGGPGRR